MKTYQIIHKPSNTNFLTPDFMDIWNELEKIPDGDSVSIKKQEMTVAEFETKIKELSVLNLTFTNPFENGSK